MPVGHGAAAQGIGGRTSFWYGGRGEELTLADHPIEHKPDDGLVRPARR